MSKFFDFEDLEMTKRKGTKMIFQQKTGKNLQPHVIGHGILPTSQFHDSRLHLVTWAVSLPNSSTICVRSDEVTCRQMLTK